MSHRPVIILATASSLQSIHPSLLRGGLFTAHHTVPAPQAQGRAKIISKVLKEMSASRTDDTSESLQPIISKYLDDHAWFASPMDHSAPQNHVNHTTRREDNAITSHGKDSSQPVSLTLWTPRELVGNDLLFPNSSHILTANGGSKSKHAQVAHMSDSVVPVKTKSSTYIVNYSTLFDI